MNHLHHICTIDSFCTNSSNSILVILNTYLALMAFGFHARHAEGRWFNPSRPHHLRTPLNSSTAPLALFKALSKHSSMYVKVARNMAKYVIHLHHFCTINQNTTQHTTGRAESMPLIDIYFGFTRKDFLCPASNIKDMRWKVHLRQILALSLESIGE